jgi:chromatin structure-remodeling complex subunit SFH1
MCLDLDIPPQVYAPQISSAIRTQIEEYAPVAEIQIPEETEMRVIVNLQLHLAKHLLRDQFEWNLSSTNDLTPEDFATLVCRDLSLSSGITPSYHANKIFLPRYLMQFMNHYYVLKRMPWKEIHQCS